MRVIEAVLPILVMLALGAFCRKWKLLSPDGIRDLKFLVTNIRTTQYFSLDYMIS